MRGSAIFTTERLNIANQSSMKKIESSCCSCDFRTCAMSGCLFYVVLGAGLDVASAQDVVPPRQFKMKRNML